MPAKSKPTPPSPLLKKSYPPAPPLTPEVKKYGPYIARVAQEQGMSLPLLVAMIMKESTGNPNAVNTEKEAQGFTQFLQGAAQEMGLTARSDPKQSIEGAARYYKQNLERFRNNPAKALAGHNSGPTIVAKTGKPRQTEEGVNFAPNVLKWAQEYQDVHFDPLPLQTLPARPTPPQTPSAASSVWETLTKPFRAEPLPTLPVPPKLPVGTVLPVSPSNIDLLRQAAKLKGQKRRNTAADAYTVDTQDGFYTLVPKASLAGDLFPSQEAAIDAYLTHDRHLGKFTSPEAAEAYAQELRRNYYPHRPLEGKGLRK